jgi:hypothetical protein
MKKYLLSFLIIGLIFNCLSAQNARKSRFIKPVNFQKRVTTVISEKNRYYYSINDEKASIINLQGPGKLRVLTRGRFVPGEKDRIKYRVVYSINGGEKQKYIISNVERSKKATYLKGSLGVPGEMVDFDIPLERGYNTIELHIQNIDIPVAARYQFIPTKKKKQEWIAFSPDTPSKPVNIISRESKVTYYRFSETDPLFVDVNGPTELRILTRIENHYQMKGRIQYRIEVSENHKVINTYQLSSRRSEIAYYEDDKELVPGKACEFVIKVPEGKHKLKIVPLDKNYTTVLGKILMPKKDVNLVNK